MAVLPSTMALHQRTSAAMADKVATLDGYIFSKDFEIYSAT
jgi:hypothetical protein